MYKAHPTRSPQSYPVSGTVLTLNGQQVYRLQSARMSIAHDTGEQEYLFVLEGTFTLLLEGQPLELQAGDHLKVTPGRVHALQNTGGTAGKILSIVLPNKGLQYSPLSLDGYTLLSSDFGGAYD
jgi:quercetin dioxygenase-like cupin family protein